MRKQNCPCMARQRGTPQCEKCDLLDEVARLQAENATLRRQVEAVTQAIQDHAESGNIENYPYLSDKIEAIGKRESS